MEVTLSLGSNTGDSCSILRGAIADLGALLFPLRAASFYETEPVGGVAQDNFVNTAVVGNYEGTPRSLLAALHGIEQKYGRDRERETRWGPRTLDIDIIFFGTSIIGDNDLVIPHPRYRERRFVLVPVLELCPDERDPLTGESLADMLTRLEGQKVRLSMGKAAAL